MATRPIVPRATGEGSIGTSAKHWGNIYADNGNIAGRNIATDGVTLDNNSSAITALQGQVTTLEHAYAGAKAAATVADMTDHNQIYVYVGSETGYTNGNWYYHNGTAWVSGGVYNATALETDKTLTISGAAADAKVVGDKVTDLYLCRPGKIETGTQMNINTTTNKIEFGVQTFICCGQKLYNVSGKSYDITSFLNGAFVCYDPDNDILVSRRNNPKDIYIGAFWNKPRRIDFNIRLDKIKVNNIPLIDTNSFVIGQITASSCIEIDTENETISGITAIYASNGLVCDNLDQKIYNVAGLNHGHYLYYDPASDEIVFANQPGTVYIGAFWVPTGKCDLNISRAKIRIDGMPIYNNSYFIGKSIAALGDSMTAGVGATKPYHQWFRQIMGITAVYTYGVEGSCITPKTDVYPEWEAGIQSFYERYTDMTNNADYIVVFGGVNDWVTGRELGTVSDTSTSTFYGAFKGLLVGLINKYPTQRIFVFTSPQNNYVKRPANIPSDNEFYGNTVGKNRKGYTLKQYTDAMVETCKIYGVACYDFQSELVYGLSNALGLPDGSAGVYGSDYLHPNNALHKIIARKMVDFIG